MKLYKTEITYTMSCVTENKVNKDFIDLLKHNIDINIGSYNMIKTDGKITANSKEIEV